MAACGPGFDQSGAAIPVGQVGERGIDVKQGLFAGIAVVGSGLIVGEEREGLVADRLGELVVDLEGGAVERTHRCRVLTDVIGKQALLEQ